MPKYSMLTNVLDRICEDGVANGFSSKYQETSGNPESLNQARARAFIHLYLLVRFGILNFSEREHYVTDAAQDGGIDGYYFDHDSKTIHLIQSKFRSTKTNFESKEIKLEEILAMDINRILSGEEADANGNFYNGKIRQLQREMAQIDGIARFKSKVIILANLTKTQPDKLRQLVGGYEVEVIDYDACYQQLVFPMISGTFFNASDLNIHVDLSNKNAGAKISYTVNTQHNECEITVLFVPTIEVVNPHFGVHPQ